jgi:hypothetical protein
VVCRVPATPRWCTSFPLDTDNHLSSAHTMVQVRGRGGESRSADASVYRMRGLAPLLSET